VQNRSAPTPLRFLETQTGTSSKAIAELPPDRVLIGLGLALSGLRRLQTVAGIRRCRVGHTHRALHSRPLLSWQTTLMRSRRPKRSAERSIFRLPRAPLLNSCLLLWATRVLWASTVVALERSGVPGMIPQNRLGRSISQRDIADCRQRRQCDLRPEPRRACASAARSRHRQ
jgi:hypothetical protein